MHISFDVWHKVGFLQLIVRRNGLDYELCQFEAFVAGGVPQFWLLHAESRPKRPIGIAGHHPKCEDTFAVKRMICYRSASVRPCTKGDPL